MQHVFRQHVTPASERVSPARHTGLRTRLASTSHPPQNASRQHVTPASERVSPPRHTRLRARLGKKGHVEWLCCGDGGSCTDLLIAETIAPIPFISLTTATCRESRSPEDSESGAQGPDPPVWGENLISTNLSNREQSPTCFCRQNIVTPTGAPKCREPLGSPWICQSALRNGLDWRQRRPNELNPGGASMEMEPFGLRRTHPAGSKLYRLLSVKSAFPRCSVDRKHQSNAETGPENTGFLPAQALQI